MVTIETNTCIISKYVNNSLNQVLQIPSFTYKNLIKSPEFHIPESDLKSVLLEMCYNR